MNKSQPHIIPNKLKMQLLKKVSLDVLLELANLVHEEWWNTKIKLGYHHPSEKHKEWNSKEPRTFCDHCHLDMVPFSDLSDSVREIDFVTVRTVLAGLISMGYEIQPHKMNKK